MVPVRVLFCDHTADLSGGEIALLRLLQSVETGVFPGEHDALQAVAIVGIGGGTPKIERGGLVNQLLPAALP